MDRAAFEAEVTHEGYDLRETAIEASEHRDSHSHGFDARLLILQGAFTLVSAEGRRTYEAGETFFVPAGTVHEELGGPDGARYLAARRAAAKAAAAE